MFKSDINAILAATYECTHTGCGFRGDAYGMYIPIESTPKNVKEVAGLAFCLHHKNFPWQEHEKIQAHFRKIKIPPVPPEALKQFGTDRHSNRRFERYVQKRDSFYKKQARAGKGKR